MREGFGPRLPVLGRDRLEDRVEVLEDPVADLLEVDGSLLRRKRRPIGERLPGVLHCGPNLVRRVRLDLPDNSP